VCQGNHDRVTAHIRIVHGPQMDLDHTIARPILRPDLDRMNDNDNRLFGITAQIALARRGWSAVAATAQHCLSTGC